MHGAAYAIHIHHDNGSVPRISQFYGIVITMYFYDYQPPISMPSTPSTTR